MISALIVILCVLVTIDSYQKIIKGINKYHVALAELEKKS